ncbi:MAG TPA: hypothetical protein VK138_00145 [Acidiferrobacterales bacterium]|nr:hypothetical protein [Acidiferrobacterales bacterium]
MPLVRVALRAGKSAKDRQAVDERCGYYAVVARKARYSAQAVLISLVEVARENWSFGNGEAQYA